MGYVFKKANGKNLIIDEQVFWNGLKDNGASLKKLLDEVSKEPKSEEKQSMIKYIDQMAFQDDRAFMFPYRSGWDFSKGGKEELKNKNALKMFKMLRDFFVKNKHKPYFLNRVGVKVVQEYMTDTPKKNAKEIKKENLDKAVKKLETGKKLPRKQKKEIQKVITKQKAR